MFPYLLFSPIKVFLQEYLKNKSDFQMLSAAQYLM